MNKYWSFCIDKLIAHKWKVLVGLLLLTGLFSYWAMQVELDYNFTKALPETDSVYIQFEEQKKQFGTDANLMFVAFTLKDKVDERFFKNFIRLHGDLEHLEGVTNVWSMKNIIRLVKDSLPNSQQFVTEPLIHISNADSLTQTDIDRGLKKYLDQPMFKNLFYNPFSHYIAMIVTIDNNVMGSPKRVTIMNRLKEIVKEFEHKNPKTKASISGMPFIMVEMADNLKNEMILLIGASALVSLLILLWCFRSLYVLVVAIVIMFMGIMWSFGFMHLFGYGITILNSLTPTLVVIIGIPNCIYVINAYRTNYFLNKDKNKALRYAIDKMGFITFVCNLIAAIGFFAFAFTESPLLIEFGWTAGLSILFLFPIALILLLIFIHITPPPNIHISYRKNVLELFTKNIKTFCYTYIQRPKQTLIVSGVIVVLMIWGMSFLTSNSYVFDNIPQNTKLEKDLKFFEQELKGVFNVDLFITSKRSITRDIQLLSRLDQLCDYVKNKDHTSNFCLSITDGLRFFRQSFYDNDPAQYSFPSTIDFALMYPYLRNTLSSNTQKAKSTDKNITNQFITTDEKTCKVSFFLENIGSQEMQVWKEDVMRVADSMLGGDVKVSIGGSGVAFVRGNEYIMGGLKDSILLSLLMISICIFLVFRKMTYILISIIPNLIPLIIILGLLGWLSVELNPSNVIIFGIAFGVSNDLTLRIMISYAYEGHRKRWLQTFISSTPSVIFTALVFIFGFSVFCISDMKNVFYIGFLMSGSMIIATLSNLIILPVLLKIYEKKSGYRHTRTL